MSLTTRILVNARAYFFSIKLSVLILFISSDLYKLVNESYYSDNVKLPTLHHLCILAWYRLHENKTSFFFLLLLCVVLCCSFASHEERKGRQHTQLGQFQDLIIPDIFAVLGKSWDEFTCENRGKIDWKECGLVVLFLFILRVSRE